MRYTLRSLLVVVTLVAALVALGLMATKDYRERMAIRSELLSMGATSAKVDSDRSISLFFTSPVTTTQWNQFKHVSAVELKGFSVDHKSLQNLAQIQAVDTLLLEQCTFADAEALAPLAAFRGLRCLLIWNTPLDDSAIDQLIAIRGLEIVDFHKTKITQQGADRLRAARPGIKVTLR